MIKNYVANKVELDNLYNQSALTWEGMSADEGNLQAITNWLGKNGAISFNATPIFHIITGKLMNVVYGLTGNNAYPDDCTLVSVTGIDQMKIVIPRFEVGGRWFDDIVDNNARREEL